MKVSMNDTFSSELIKNVSTPVAAPRDNIFSRVMNSLGSVAQRVGSNIALEPQYQGLLDKQVELQQQMLLVSLQSNVEKTKHDIAMAPVRNIRVM